MRKFGLIGKSLGHSFSKDFFTNYFKSNQIDASYENIELESIDAVSEILTGNYRGFNVTIPYKEEIIPFLDDLSSEAKEIGAVNVIAFEKGRTVGYNTDAFGFQQSIKPFLANQHTRAIIFGTGGSSRAVEFVLKSLGVEVIFISRNPKGDNEFAYNEVNEHMMNACKLLINCTPVGTFPIVEDAIEIPYQHLTESHLVVDLIYNPSKTMFLQNAERFGATILNGESMLMQQALKSWEIWNQ